MMDDTQRGKKDESGGTIVGSGPLLLLAYFYYARNLHGKKVK